MKGHVCKVSSTLVPERKRMARARVSRTPSMQLSPPLFFHKRSRARHRMFDSSSGVAPLLGLTLLVQADTTSIACRTLKPGHPVSISIGTVRSLGRETVVRSVDLPQARQSGPRMAVTRASARSS